MSGKGTIQLLIDVKLTDKNGNVVKQFKQRPSKSYVLQFLQIFGMTMNHIYGGNPATITPKDTANSAQTIPYTSSTDLWRHIPAIVAAAADSTYGVQVGTGTEALDNTNYKLQTQIAHGSGAGQLLYGASTFVPASVIGANVDLLIIRTFTNNTGNGVTVQEIGLVLAYMNATSSQKNFLIVRDLYNVEIANGLTATVTYTLRTTV